jgi:hypothetical protein
MVVQSREHRATIDVLFSSGDGTNAVLESAGVGELVARVSVTDVDPTLQLDTQQSINVTLHGAHGYLSLQNIETNGVFVLLVAKELDRETIDEISFVLSASTATSGLLAKKNVTMKIIDVNDNTPRFQQQRYEAEVRETSSIGASVLKVSERVN